LLGARHGIAVLAVFNTHVPAYYALRLVYDAETTAKRLIHEELVVKASVAPNSGFKGRKSFEARALVV
jgi:hypothetical protein